MNSRVCLTAVFSLVLLAGPGRGAGLIEWGRLADIPDREGLAGVFAGVVNDGGKEVLLVAGGANFPDGRPWEGGKKVYHDAVHALAPGGGAGWTTLNERWPVPVAYGMPVTLPARGSCLFIGGKNLDAASGKERALDAAWEARMDGGKLVRRELPGLPVPCAEGVAVLVGSKVVVAAGATNKSGDPADGFVTSRRAFALDTDRDENEWAWEELPWPEDARGRMHAVAGVRNGKFYLFGGRDFAASEDAAEERIFGLDFLRDCYEWDFATRTWRRLADLPEARSAAPSPAVAMGASHLVMLGGVPVQFLREQVAARPATNGQGMDHP
ncbi:MAG: hypothetical protein HKO57_12790, partial [Akkermansiaceae bacterium]|nr:hypothetical protein [Akkermansiaceae bacterium]